MPKRLCQLANYFAYLHLALAFAPSCNCQAQLHDENDASVDNNFILECIASEPHVLGPVDCAWDKRGMLYVADICKSIDKFEGTREGNSRIQILRDTNKDGIMDSSKTFALLGGLIRGIQPFRGGILATVGDKVILLTDTNDDGVAEETQTLFFASPDDVIPGSFPFNSPAWGLDNCMHFCNGGSIEKIYRRHDPNGYEYIGSENFKWEPFSDRFYMTGGDGVYGGCFDITGRYFFRTMEGHIATIAIPHLLANQARGTGLSCNTETVWSSTSQSVKSRALGMHFYGGTLFPDFRNHLFVCDASTRSVLRFELIQKFDEVVPALEPKAEFFRIHDKYSVPVSIHSAPDGSILISTVSRSSMAESDVDFDENEDRPTEKYRGGRLWRVRPKPSPLNLAVQALPNNPTDLVQLLGHSDSWHRQSAQRLLVELIPSRGDAVCDALARQPPPSDSGLMNYLSVCQAVKRLIPEVYAAKLETAAVLDGIARILQSNRDLHLNAAHCDLTDQALPESIRPSARERMFVLSGAPDRRYLWESLVAFPDSHWIRELALYKSVSGYSFFSFQQQSSSTGSQHVKQRPCTNLVLFDLLEYPPWLEQFSSGKYETVRRFTSTVLERGNTQEIEVALRALQDADSEWSWWKVAMLNGLIEGLSRRKNSELHSLPHLLSNPPKELRAVAREIQHLFNLLNEGVGQP